MRPVYQCQMNPEVVNELYEIIVDNANTSPPYSHVWSTPRMCTEGSAPMACDYLGRAVFGRQLNEWEGAEVGRLPLLAVAPDAHRW